MSPSKVSVTMPSASPLLQNERKAWSVLKLLFDTRATGLAPHLKLAVSTPSVPYFTLSLPSMQRPDRRTLKVSPSLSVPLAMSAYTGSFTLKNTLLLLILKSIGLLTEPATISTFEQLT